MDFQRTSKGLLKDFGLQTLDFMVYKIYQFTSRSSQVFKTCLVSRKRHFHAFSSFLRTSEVGIKNVAESSNNNKQNRKLSSLPGTVNLRFLSDSTIGVVNCIYFILHNLLTGPPGWVLKEMLNSREILSTVVEWEQNSC